MLQFHIKHQSLTLGSLSSSSSSGLKASAHTGFGKTNVRRTFMSLLSTQWYGLQSLWWLKWAYPRVENKNHSSHLFVETDCKRPPKFIMLTSVLSKYWTSLNPLFFSVSWDSFSFLSVLCLPLSSIMRAVLRWEAHCSPLPHAPGVPTIITSKEHDRSIHCLDRYPSHGLKMSSKPNLHYTQARWNVFNRRNQLIKSYGSCVHWSFVWFSNLPQNWCSYRFDASRVETVTHSVAYRLLLKTSSSKTTH